MEIRCYTLQVANAANAACRRTRPRTAERLPIWEAFGVSARGAKHVKQDMPNQDSIAMATASSSSDGCLIVAGDGHGSLEYFRADRGSLLACSFAKRWGVKLLDNIAKNRASKVGVLQGQILSSRICDSWLAAVQADIAQCPFTATEWAKVPDKELRQFTEHPHTAYGTTLLVALAWKTGMMALQLGDGDIVSVSDDCQWRQLIEPLEGDERTADSLCDAAAVDKFRIHVEQFENDAPSCVMVQTDGWTKSFENDSEQMNFDLDIAKWLHASGKAAVEAELPEILSQMSATGWSRGDDISCAAMFPMKGPKDDK